MLQFTGKPPGIGLAQMTFSKQLLIPEQLRRQHVCCQGASMERKHTVRSQNLIGIMRNHQNGIPFITHPPQNIQQLIPAPLV
ncbi:hypothetical protein D3C81_2178090 [compost metagenome]